MPRHATLESLLREHELPQHMVQAAIDVGPRRLQSASAARQPAVPPGAVARRLPARVRVSDRRRSVPPHHQSRSRRRPACSTPRSFRTTRRRGRRRSAASIDARASVADRRDGRRRASESSSPSRWPRSSAARSTSRTTCSRAMLRGAVREVDATRASSPATARSSARGFINERQGAPGLPLGQPGDEEGGLLRRAGPLVEALRARVAAAVHAARHVGLLARAACIRCIGTYRAASRRRLRAPPPARPSSRSPMAWSCRRDGRAAAARQVRIRHAGGLESYYLHLSSFGAAFAPARASIRGS